MGNFPVLKVMIEQVAKALGPELCQKMTFVGGCTTGLLLTDGFTKEQVRHTDDVDLIVQVITYSEFHQLQQQLIKKGFSLPAHNLNEKSPICAMQLNNLKVDFMPSDGAALGFENRWYKDAMKTAIDYDLTNEIAIKLVTPVYFMATKLEAYKGRGNGDVLESRDIEDILNLVDGREELLDEIQSASPDLRQYIAKELGSLLKDANFDYAIQSQAQGNTDREEVIYQRLEELTSYMPEDHT